MTGFFIASAVGVFVDTIVLMALPFIEKKNPKACFLVALIVAVLSVPILFLSSLIQVIAGFILWIPLIGSIAAKVVSFFFYLIFATIGFVVADQLVEDFESPSLLDSFACVVVLGFTGMLSNFAVGLFI